MLCYFSYIQVVGLEVVIAKHTIRNIFLGIWLLLFSTTLF